MQMLDASSALHAWDNYPLDQFPPLWAWLAHQISTRQLTIASVAMEEVGHKSPDCGGWLRARQITVLNLNEPILMDALRIKTLLGVEGELYGSGVDENDLFIIATARHYGAELLSNEARQPSLPQQLRSYKIPAVCALSEVRTPCLNFVEYIKRSRVVFG